MNLPLEDRLARISALPAHMALARSGPWGHDIDMTRHALGTIQRYWDGESYSKRPLRRVACQLRGLTLCVEQWREAGDRVLLVSTVRALASELLSRAAWLVPSLAYSKAFRAACHAVGEPAEVVTARKFPDLDPLVRPDWMHFPASLLTLSREPGRRFFCVKCGSHRSAERMIQCAECGDLLCDPCAWDRLDALEDEGFRCGCGGLAQNPVAWWGLLDLTEVPWEQDADWRGPPRMLRRRLD